MAIFKTPSKGLASLFSGKVGKKVPPPLTPVPPIGWGPGIGPACPHPEEEILLADDSWIKAKDIKTGDKVKTLTAKDFKEGEYEITRAEIIDNQPRCEVFFKDSKSIISSYSHPYAVEDKGFVEAQDIKVGDTVGDLIVTATKPLDWGPVVSLSVDEAETYMLKAGSEDKPVAVLSHNKSPLPTPPPTITPTYPGGTTPPPQVVTPGTPGTPDEVAPRPPWDPTVTPIETQPITVPGPGESIKAKVRVLQMQKKRLMKQIAQIDLQIRSLLGGLGTPIRPPDNIPWAPIGPGQPPTIGPLPPTPIGPGLPVPIGPGTPIPQPPPPPPPPWKTDPPWGG